MLCYLLNCSLPLCKPEPLSSVSAVSIQELGEIAVMSVSLTYEVPQADSSQMYIKLLHQGIPWLKELFLFSTSSSFAGIKLPRPDKVTPWSVLSTSKNLLAAVSAN